MDWFSEYVNNPRVRRVADFDDAIGIIEQETEGTIDPDNPVTVRGTMASVDEGYEVPGSETSEESQQESSFDFESIEPAGDPTPEYIASIDEVLEWGTEKGSEAEWVRMAGYAGDEANIHHSWKAMDNTPYNLDDWNVAPEHQEMTRPVMLVYDDEELDHSLQGYDTGLPVDPEERSAVIDYAIVIDQDPTSDHFQI
jgi:hypothetical protein